MNVKGIEEVEKGLIFDNLEWKWDGDCKVLACVPIAEGVSIAFEVDWSTILKGEIVVFFVNPKVVAKVDRQYII